MRYLVLLPCLVHGFDALFLRRILAFYNVFMSCCLMLACDLVFLELDSGVSGGLLLLEQRLKDRDLGLVSNSAL